MASSGNGIDFGHVVAMLHDLAEGQRNLSDGQRLLVESQQGLLETQRNLLESQGEIRAVLADHGRRLERVEGRLDRVEGGLDSLREAVTMYHASVLGHGVLISELDARVRRIEHHLNLPPAA